MNIQISQYHKCINNFNILFNLELDKYSFELLSIIQNMIISDT